MRTAPQPLPIESLTDRLHCCVRALKLERDANVIAEMKSLTETIRSMGYHPYYLPKHDVIYVSNEAVPVLVEAGNA